MNSIFGTEQFDLGLGFHNIGTGIMRYANPEIIKIVENHYGQRCGHIPLNAKKLGILVQQPDDNIHQQMAYLSALYGRKIHVFTPDEIEGNTQIAPYVLVPETEAFIQSLNAKPWGLPGKMTHVLKNKAEFYQLVEKLKLDGFSLPDYIIAHLDKVVTDTKQFIKKIANLYDTAGVSNYYPLGVMMRASDEDGNYGTSLVYENNGYLIVVPNGDAQKARVYGNWDEALLVSHHILAAAMNPDKEPRVVVSRYIDMLDSPGISLVMLDGTITSLNWNGQLMKEGSRACVGTSTYKPKTNKIRDLQKRYESKTAELFETLLRKTAAKLDVDFNTIRGIANTDIMLVSDLELELQKKLGREETPFYLAECNPRFTNYTDAILTVIAAQKKEQTVDMMKEVISEGISTMDKYVLPKGIDPRTVRELIFDRDQKLKDQGTRLICRMTDNPMGLIFAGNTQWAEKEMEKILRSLTEKQWQIAI